MKDSEWELARRRKFKILFGISMVGLFLFCSAAFGEDLSPEVTVSKYYDNMKNSHFEQAYEYISQNMRDGRSKDKWAEDWRKILKSGKVLILEVQVSPSKIEGNKATVRVKIRSTDIFNPKGLVEEEIDHLIKEKNVWKIDETEVLFE